ncbi:MAG: polyphosphate kinase 2 [Magnetococcales bacterium]|nr:polyphosphate kinase 2 [Magnetococcales bacterium]
MAEPVEVPNLSDEEQRKLLQKVAKLKADNKKLRAEKKQRGEEEAAALRKYRHESEIRTFASQLIVMQRHLEESDRKMIILFEGRDAAGKGGAIRRITRFMNQKHYRVVALGKPTREQRSQWFFQKYVEHFPRGGEIILFDRSWYNRAMVEPVFGFCTEQEHDNFMRGVVGFEKDLARQGIMLFKFYFSVTKEEQERRFDIRRFDPLEQWKLSEVDLQAQDRWEDFTERKLQMLKRTHTSETPWTVIRSDNKHLARLNAIKVLLSSVNYEGRNTELDFVPDPKIVTSGALEIEKMSTERMRNGNFST